MTEILKLEMRLRLLRHIDQTSNAIQLIKEKNTDLMISFVKNGHCVGAHALIERANEKSYSKITDCIEECLQSDLNTLREELEKIS